MELGLYIGREFQRSGQFGLLTHIAATVNASLCMPMKS
jgi:hypothetical protein